MTAPLPWARQPGPSTWGTGPTGGTAPQPLDGPPQVSTLPLALGGLGLVLFPFLGGLLLGLPALILGLRRRRRAQRAGRRDGRSTAGAVLGGIALAATVAFTAYVATSPAFRDYLSCVQDADSDQEVSRCEAALRERVSGG
ncbi:MAG: hypothetical protein Q8R60_15875 [Mycobacteriales bacterium]|nr:hypothetical protein [Mycobacteriales bacterium]